MLSVFTRDAMTRKAGGEGSRSPSVFTLAIEPCESEERCRNHCYQELPNIGILTDSPKTAPEIAWSPKCWRMDSLFSFVWKMVDWGESRLKFTICW